MLKRAGVGLADGVIHVGWEDDKDADVTSVDFWDAHSSPQRRAPMSHSSRIQRVELEMLSDGISGMSVDIVAGRMQHE